MKQMLLLPKISIHNANALSSPYTIGFPAMTAWFGAVHALQRRMNQTGNPEPLFNSIGVVCHAITLHTHRGRGDYVHSIVGTGNPLDKNGERPSFIEEARCDLNISLIVECENLPLDREALRASLSGHINAGWKVAGGDILAFSQPEFIAVDEIKALRSLMRRVMPGYALIERRDLMIDAMQNGADAIDALLDYLKVAYRSEIADDGTVEWTAKRKSGGWIVPIATGFHGVSEPGRAENQRDPDTPHRFAESLVTLGEFRMPYRIRHLDEILWRSRYDAENHLYLIEQNHRSRSPLSPLPAGEG
ncbi:type I-F CRISPR-associated protein Csy2 [Candidatus Methylospira mobilis]|uniref:Type I-F CRISPR-associated protein Csy2 n=1 Tax=Candidatus Methylospira mobilis TaxID=1808979 RepID=A0A5Q0BLX3_9GAMM|nr:type I-F CRISPR-associated protein Csy2 [Candidatus Methylospira mobilis]QFY44833.1 type I-F CRISPR-associated protein Csy2 [Candidatus Methylospira mobilis]